MVDIRKWTSASAMVVVLALLTGRVGSEKEMSSLESLCPRLMTNVNTDLDGEYQNFLATGGLWGVMQRGEANVDESNILLWIESMVHKTCDGDIFVGTVASFAEDGWKPDHTFSAVVADDEARLELEFFRGCLIEAFDQIESGETLSSLSISDVVRFFLFLQDNSFLY